MGWDSKHTGIYTFYICLGVISILSNAAVIYEVAKSRKKLTSSTISFIILALHISIFVEGIAVLPYIFSEVNELCITVEFIHYYCVVLHMIAVSFLIQVYYGTLFEDRFKIKAFIRDYGVYLIYTLPLIVLFRLSDDGYQNTLYPFCVVHRETFGTLLLVTHFIWIWAALTGCTLFIIFATYKIYKKSDAYIAWRFFASVGMYIMAALIGWIPATVIAFAFPDPEDDDTTSDQQFVSYIPLYISGIIYALIFIRNREAIEQFETNSWEAMKSETFSVDGLDLMKMLRSSMGWDDRRLSELRSSVTDVRLTEMTTQNPINPAKPDQESALKEAEEAS